MLICGVFPGRHAKWQQLALCCLESSMYAIIPTEHAVRLLTLHRLAIHLMKCLAKSQGPKIRINAILPGLLLTEWVSRTCSALGLMNTENLPGSTLLARSNRRLDKCDNPQASGKQL